MRNLSKIVLFWFIGTSVARWGENIVTLTSINTINRKIMEHHEWVNAAYRSTAKAIEECYNISSIDGWSENYITTRVIEAIAKLGLEIDWKNKPIKTKWEGLKLKGNAENKYGDIAILVRVWLTGDRFVDGVVFYEAKRQYFKENNEAIGFKSIKPEQLVKLESESHASNILLYDLGFHPVGRFLINGRENFM